MIQKKSFGTYTAKVIIWLVVILMTLSCLLPLINMIAISLSGSSAVASNQVGLLPVDFTLNTYSKLLNDGQFWTSFWISIQRVVLGTLINMFFVISMAYPLSKSKLRFPAREIYIKFVIFAMLFSGGIIPLYMVVSGLKLTDTIWALVVLQSFSAFGVFLMRQFYLGIPNDLSEAARIDGLSEYGIWARIILPLSKPAIATLCIFTFVNTWNDYMGPMIYLTSDLNKTIQVGLRRFIQAFSADYNLIMAASLCSLLPVTIVFLFLQRYFIEGIATTGMKG